MKASPTSPRSGNVFDELAQRVRQVVRDVHGEMSGVDRFVVQRLSPFTIGELHGDLVLEEGDPDFAISHGLRAQLTASTVQLNDMVWATRHFGEWMAFDVVSPDS